jgi:hypothetical protein
MRQDNITRHIRVAIHDYRDAASNPLHAIRNLVSAIRLLANRADESNAERSTREVPTLFSPTADYVDALLWDALEHHLSQDRSSFYVLEQLSLALAGMAATTLDRFAPNVRPPFPVKKAPESNG